MPYKIQFIIDINHLKKTRFLPLVCKNLKVERQGIKLSLPLFFTPPTRHLHKEEHLRLFNFFLQISS